MKKESLNRSIIINFSFCAALAALVGFIVFFTSSQNDKANQEIIKIRSQAANMKEQVIELESQVNDAKKYKEIWKSISPRKKSTEGIKMEEVNKSLEFFAQKYAIRGQQIQILLPENLNGGPFERKTVNIIYSSGTLNFNAASDVAAFSFMKDFFDSLPGYIVITNVDLTKGRKYTNADYVNISLGKDPEVLKVKITFAWYAYRDKEKKDDSGAKAQ